MVTPWSPTEDHSLVEGSGSHLNRVLWTLEGEMTDFHRLWMVPLRKYQRTHKILPHKVVVGWSRVRTSQRGGAGSM